MKIYTRKGDNGSTQLIGGTRVSKSHIRIDAYGTVDELNSWIGLVADNLKTFTDKLLMKEIQDRLFTIGSLLASDPDKSNMKVPDLLNSDIELLEQSIDNFQADLPELKSFVLPGGSSANSICHIARCVCRRAERMVVLLNESEKIERLIIIYLNRLSDFLFVLSRKISFDAGSEELLWKPRL
ncbi:MAG: cob(I)yrinic acid a,c-diamide adenosyltransferase [Chitinophagales bacterium]|nr:cob(I)yrinic acid a,c-diamide adenosyltransferase [Chitinophagales bacterium]